MLNSGGFTYQIQFLLKPSQLTQRRETYDPSSLLSSVQILQGNSVQ